VKPDDTGHGQDIRVLEKRKQSRKITRGQSYGSKQRSFKGNKREKRNMCNRILQEVEEEQEWRALKYTGQIDQEMVKTLRYKRRELVTSWDKKIKQLKQVRFPKLQEGTIHQVQVQGGFSCWEIGREEVCAAVFEQSTRKAAGQNRFNFDAI
jgi:hypothetical protein